MPSMSDQIVLDTVQATLQVTGFPGYTSRETIFPLVLFQKTKPEARNERHIKKRG
jgi:hypothetical protein